MPRNMIVRIHCKGMSEVRKTNMELVAKRTVHVFIFVWKDEEVFNLIN